MPNNRQRGGAQTLVIISLVIVAALIFLLTQNTKRPTPGDGDGSDGATQPLVLYCAAGIIQPVQAAADAYEREFGVPIQIEPGGSGKLLSQLKIAPGRG
ncbi:MAG: substrate-binding domain-containing protein, partial [Planctomycetota bacterium]